MSGSKFPTKIESMIVTGYNKNWTSKKIADHINNSKTAKNLQYKVSSRSIAAKIANYNR